MSIFQKYTPVLMVALMILIAPVKLMAQRDTTATAAKTDSIIEYLTPLEYAFMMHEKTRFMLRAPAIGVGAEVEVLPYITLMGQFYFPSSDNGNSSYFKLDAEMRWYYGSRKKGVRNMSGNYIALGYKYGLYNFSEYYDGLNFFYGRWGIQRRVIGKGLIDLGINAGYQTSNYTYLNLKNNGILLQSTGIVGLGLVFNKEKALDTDRLCPVLKCYQKESFLLKLNAINLFSVYHSETLVSDRYIINPQIGLEQKLFDAPFSIGVDFLLNYTWEKNTYSGQFGEGIYKSNYGYLTGRAYARYYYNMKNRIRKGKSGDGLSANYISGGILSQYKLSKYRNAYTDPLNTFLLTTGVQRTFGNHFYFDVELGGGIDPRPHYSPLLFYGNFQLGIKF